MPTTSIPAVRRAVWHTLHDISARHFVRRSERPDIEGTFGKMAKEYLDQIGTLWHQFKGSRLLREEVQERTKDLLLDIEAVLLLVQENARDRKSVALARDLRKRFPTLWTFLKAEGVEPTNNRAERALRPIVILRKLSLGSQSEWGARYVERLMTVAYTLKENGKDLFAFLVKLFQTDRETRAPPFPITSSSHFIEHVTEGVCAKEKSFIPPPVNAYWVCALQYDASIVTHP